VHPRPIPAGRDAWPSYAAIAVVGFLLYAVGAAGPYVRDALDLSNAQVGLHSTAMAIGLTTSGVVVTALARRVGERAVRAGVIGGLGLAAAAFGLAPAFGVSLSAALAIGFGTGTLLGYANATLARPGGRAARTRLARANVWAMVAGFACPLAIAAAVAANLPWGLGLLPVIVPLAVAALDLGGGPGAQETGPAVGAGRLPRGFWIAWGLAAAAMAMEYSFIFWGSTLVGLRTGVDLPSATTLAGLFVGGMLAGRTAQALGLGTRGDPRRPAVAGVALAAVGATGAWASTVPLLSGAAFVVAGIGVGGLYPLAAATALAAAPGRIAVAGPRLTLATGLAMMATPLLLGALTDVAGVLTGWWVVIVVGAVGLGLAAALPGGRRT
jgi:MFS family permease